MSLFIYFLQLEDRQPTLMQWTCKFCNFTCDKRGQLLKHYRLKHGGYTRTSPLPCVHKECPCTFKSFNALKVHISRAHSQIDDHCDPTKYVFQCQLCDFNEPCVEKICFHTYGTYPDAPKSTVPLQDCNFETCIYTMFNAHKSRNHDGRQIHSQLQFKPDILTKSGAF